jgi:hypothetical protein
MGGVGREGDQTDAGRGGLGIEARGCRESFHHCRKSEIRGKSEVEPAMTWGSPFQARLFSFLSQVYGVL